MLGKTDPSIVRFRGKRPHFTQLHDDDTQYMGGSGNKED